MVPTPELVQFILPSAALAFSMNSFIDWIGDCAGTTNTLGDAPITISGTKSLSGS